MVKCLCPLQRSTGGKTTSTKTPDTTYFANDPLDRNGRLVAERHVPADSLAAGRVHRAIRWQHESHGLDGRERLRTAVGAEGWQHRELLGRMGADRSIFQTAPGSQDYKWNIENCNQQPVGIAKQPEACTAVNEPIGCIECQNWHRAGPDKSRYWRLRHDRAARWPRQPTAHSGPGQETIVGRAGHVEPAHTSDGGAGHQQLHISRVARARTCIGKVANIIGFFAEGMCKDVTLDPGMAL